jgi:hypothetical protein
MTLKSRITNNYCIPSIIRTRTGTGTTTETLMFALLPRRCCRRRRPWLKGPDAHEVEVVVVGSGRVAWMRCPGAQNRRPNRDRSVVHGCATPSRSFCQSRRRLISVSCSAQSLSINLFCLPLVRQPRQSSSRGHQRKCSCFPSACIATPNQQ